jgi:excisionase family DNA binding protein
MGHTIPHVDRYERASDAIDRIAGGVKELYAIWLEVQANDQGETGASAIAATPAQGDEPLMTVEGLADYLKIQAPTLREWARTGRIPCERANSEIRFRRAVIDQWLAEGRRDKGEERIETAHASEDIVIKSSRSILRPQTRSKSNGRV